MKPRIFREKGAKVGVIGLGYVGLPLVLRFCEEGFRVLGFDVDPTKVERLNRGESYIGHIPDERLRKFKARFQATTDMDRLGEADAILICVPTPLTERREPDLKYVRKTAEEVSQRLRSGQLVCLESTTYPGTTREVLLPILEGTGLKVGRDFHLVYSPEREDPGNPRFTTKTIPKLVGGVTPRCLEAGVALYSAVVEKVVPVSSPEVAEAAKLLENIYRAVNIALVNVEPHQPAKEMHIHDRDEELWMILNGRGLVIFDGGFEAEVEAGDIIYCPLGGEHHIRNIGDEVLAIFNVHLPLE